MRQHRQVTTSPLKAENKHLVVPKDLDGAYRVHNRLDGKRITTFDQQLAVRALMNRGLMT